jgi:hypothetical protein
MQNRAGQPIESKAVAATGATFVASEIVWAVFTFWPAARNAVPAASDQLQLVSLLSTVLTWSGAYLAPHTHRPDIYPVSPPPGYIPATPQPVANGDDDGGGGATASAGRQS